MVGRGGRDRRRGPRHQAGRPRHVLGRRRLCRIRGHRLGPRLADPGQQYELRAGGDLADRAPDHARRDRHQWAPQSRRERADPGRELRRRPDGPADRQAQGREAGDRHLDQRRRAARGSRNSAPTSRSITRDPAWPEQVLEATERQGRQSHHRPGLGERRQREHEGGGGARPHRQCRPARRRQGRVRFRPARDEAHRLYRRHLPHALGRGGARDRAPDARRSLGRASRPASSRCRSTAPSRSTRPWRRRRTCAPTRISARSC